MTRINTIAAKGSVGNRKVMNNPITAKHNSINHISFFILVPKSQ